MVDDISRRMRAIRRQNTAAEIALQSALKKIRHRFRTHVRIGSCAPDLLFRTSRLAVFVDGDFWHGRLLVEQGEAALANSFRSRPRAFWRAKIARNVARDRRQTNWLRRHGWSVVRLWERDVLRDAHAAAALVAKRLAQRKRQRLRGAA